MVRCWVKHGNRNVAIDILSTRSKGIKISCGLEILSNQGRAFIQWHPKYVAVTLKEVKEQRRHLEPCECLRVLFSHSFTPFLL